MSVLGRISVIVPSYMSRDLTQVVDSIKALDPLEILVVDSSPSRPDVHDPLVQVVHVDAQILPGAARNLGASKARGEFLLFIDSDVVLTDNACEFVRRRVNTGENGIVSGVYAADGPRAFFSRLQTRILRYRLTESGDPGDPRFSSSHFLIKQETFTLVGGFHEAIATYEDMEFLARCTKLGVPPEASAEFEGVHLKEYSFIGLLKDYFQKAYRAFQVRRRYRRVFRAVPPMLGRDLQLGWISGALCWIPLLACLLLGFEPFTGAVALGLFLAPYPFLRRLMRSEGPWAAEVTLLCWPVVGVAIALATVASAVAWTGSRIKQRFYFVSDMLRALKRVVIRTGLPVQIIAYVTARCNLRCEHCFYKETLDKPDRGELPLEVFNQTTQSIGPVLWFSLAGGEPFVRKDLNKLIEVIQTNCRPKVFSFPTNGWYTQSTFDSCLRVMQQMDGGNLILFFSLDGPKEMHDQIRGAGSFDRVKATMARLRPLTTMYPNLYLNVITTVTERNADVAAEFIDELVRDFSPSAISINLFRYHSLEHPPLPAKVLDGYKAAVDSYSKYLRDGALKHYGFVGGRILLFKEILQKDLIYRVAKFNEFVTPCTAGTLSYVIMEDGRVTPCEILPDTIGTVGGAETFREMVTNAKAKKLRTWIAETECKCTYECAMSTNTLFSWPMSKRMISSLLRDVSL